MYVFLLAQLLMFVEVQGLCADNVRWLHSFNMEDIYGLWYGVGYAQHTPDMTNKPNEVGCVTLHLADATYDRRDYIDWRDWSIPRRNYEDQNWESQRSNPWTGTSLSRSWLDIPARKMKRHMFNRNEKRLRVIWDEDGQTMEQTYVYSPDDPGLWVVQRWHPGEKEMVAGGIDMWYPDELPYHPEVIRVLNMTEDVLIINHCSDSGSGGVFSLIFKRSYERIERRRWYDMQNQFYSYEIPSVYRFTAVCAACDATSSFLCVILCVIASVISAQ